MLHGASDQYLFNGDVDVPHIRRLPTVEATGIDPVEADHTTLGVVLLVGPFAIILGLCLYATCLGCKKQKPEQRSGSKMPGQ